MADFELVKTENGTEYYEGSGTFSGKDISNGKDHITGGDGIDTIDAGTGEDTLIGLGGDDVLNGENGDDTLIGGEGDDRLTGGKGADSFEYGFTLTAGSGSSGPQSYADYLEQALGKAYNDGTLTQNEFSTTYSDWLNYLVFGDGEDWQGLVEHFGWEGEVTIGLNQNGAGDSQPHIGVDGVAQDLDEIFGGANSFGWTKGQTTQTRTFWDLDENYAWGSETDVSSSDGNDTISDFKVADGDKLLFTIDIEADPATLDDTQKNELFETFKAQFDITTGDFDGDAVAEGAVDTRIMLDDSMSITLLGYAGGDDIWAHVEHGFV